MYSKNAFVKIGAVTILQVHLSILMILIVSYISISALDLKEPVVLVVPPIRDRYSTFQFVDAYTNDYAYLGQRATKGIGGTYLIIGPDWNGKVPEGMTPIWPQILLG